MVNILFPLKERSQQLACSSFHRHTLGQWSDLIHAKPIPLFSRSRTIHSWYYAVFSPWLLACYFTRVASQFHTSSNSPTSCVWTMWRRSIFLLYCTVVAAFIYSSSEGVMVILYRNSSRNWNPSWITLGRFKHNSVPYMIMIERMTLHAFVAVRKPP